MYDTIFSFFAFVHSLYSVSFSRNTVVAPVGRLEEIDWVNLTWLKLEGVIRPLGPLGPRSNYYRASNSLCSTRKLLR